MKKKRENKDKKIRKIVQWISPLTTFLHNLDKTSNYSISMSSSSQTKQKNCPDSLNLSQEKDILVTPNKPN